MFSYAAPRVSAGAGYAMVSDRYLALLGAAAGVERALVLWGAIGDDGTDLDDLVAAAADTPDAAIVELVDAGSREMRVVVRGEAAARLAGGGAEKRRSDVDAVGDADGQGQWQRRTARGITGLELRLSETDADAQMLPFGRGVVRSSLLRWGAPVPADAPSEAPAPLETRAIDRLPYPGARAADAEPIDDDTTLSVRHARQPVLRVGDDRIVPLDLPVVLGRALRPAAHPGARLVTLPSPHREISGTHLELRREGEQLHARDLDSTNGTIVRDADGATTLLRHGADALLAVGAVLDLGDDVIVRFEREA